jgi:mRNA interferase RelE/StbE
MRVVLERKAAKQLERMNEPMKSRIIAELRNLEKEPPQGDIKKLRGKSGAYRLRVGGYRVLYREWEDCIAVYKIGLRGQAYTGD